MRLLVVDDDVLILGLIQEALADRPVDLLLASSIREALALWQSHHSVDGVLLDVSVGRDDGMDVARTLLAEGLPVDRIVVMTGLDMAFREPFPVLRKPFPLRDLWALVDRWTDVL